MANDLDKLRAEAAAAQAAAAEAEAKAAAAKAAALQAELAAAEAAAGGAAPQTTPDASAVADSEPTPAQGPAVAAQPPVETPVASANNEVDLADATNPENSTKPEIRDAYSPKGLHVTLGALRQDDGSPDPATLIKVPLAMFNRHGLVAGATGTGKTRTLQLLAEALSGAGVPVLLSDVKGDLTGVAQAGTGSEKLLKRTQANGQAWEAHAFGAEFMTIGDATLEAPGVSLRTTVTNMGPLLLARALDLNETQEQALQLVFAWADQKGLELDDLKDLRAVISFLTSDEGKEHLKSIGGISPATAGVILRAVSALESQGGSDFFGEPAFDTADLLRKTTEGEGVINVLRMRDLSSRPALISTFLMWVLADLFNHLPEVGDAPAPKLVFFFDEAHLLFKDASKEFLRQIVQTVRLIRSKGVGVFFVTQTPKDVPADVLGQLAGRVQHALRAFTPNDAKALKATVSTFPKSEYDLEELLTTLGTGEAVITFLDEDGRPSPVAPTRLWAPRSVMGPADEPVLKQIMNASTLMPKYANRVDDRSAFEVLTEQDEQRQAAAQAQAEQDARVAEEAAARKAREAKEKEMERLARTSGSGYGATRRTTTSSRAPQSTVEKALGSLARSVGTQLGREITRTLFGTRRR
ncbi:ATPase [Boudabousia tangfeifanii]|uniref:ATPase n=1 Tax=Boudabousia tangfeifanii TaxID=1912795 RepID=A0A1D9MKP9_9ACTO|nr:helicase HerA-like domain-containing protein [Boudabousia tangfeifanii]AOZ72931.1 ATPase [Boudabousia tangfeifanii]